MLKVRFVDLCRAAVAPEFFFFLLKLGSKVFYCLTRYAGMFSTEEKEGNNCFAAEVYVSCLKERSVSGVVGKTAGSQCFSPSFSGARNQNTFV